MGLGLGFSHFFFKSTFVKPLTLSVLGSEVKVKNFPAPREMD